MTVHKTTVTYVEHSNGTRSATINGKEVSPDHPKIKTFNQEMSRMSTAMDEMWGVFERSMKRISRAFRDLLR